jgi:hypothetical protein
MWLTAATAACLALPAAAAPAPAPSSPGPISEAVRLSGIVPRTAPPLASRAVAAGEGVIELELRTMTYVAEAVTENVATPDGKVVPVTRFVTKTVPQAVTVAVKADGVKFFTVTKDGKLEALDAAKAAGLLKKRTAVLTGESADVDPRNLELVKPGTLYLVLPRLDFETPPPPPAPPGADKK